MLRWLGCGYDWFVVVVMWCYRYCGFDRFCGLAGCSGCLDAVVAGLMF